MKMTDAGTETLSYAIIAVDPDGVEYMEVSYQVSVRFEQFDELAR
jgi:hypothetical protein